MEMITWCIQTSPQGVVPVIMSEYLFNDMGVFVKREKRMPKKALLTAITGFRIGYAAIPGTDYRATPIDRNAILWYKVTSVTEDGEYGLTVRGNRNDEIEIRFFPEDREAILHYLAAMRQQHPAITSADYTAASWLCWRDDDDWGDPFITLSDMIENELQTERFIEPEILEETELTAVPDYTFPDVGSEVIKRPKFCANCGAALPSDGSFCENCGSRILL